MFVYDRRSDDEQVKQFSPPRDAIGMISRRCRDLWIQWGRHCSPRQVAPGYDAFTDDRSRFGSAPLAQMPKCSIVNLHWIAGLLDISALPLLSSRSPVIWTLHDMNPFTGGCHFDLGCGRYQLECGCCPQLASANKSDRSHFSYLRKASIYGRLDPSRLQFVTPSRYMADLARNSALLRRFPVHVIPNGLDADVFSPTDRLAARRFLGLPLNEPIVLFVAQSVQNRRKGCQFIIEALKGMNRRLTLVSVGSGTVAAGNGSQVHLGEIGDDSRLALIYSAADLFVMGSIQDNLPNTVLESMACGTPTVAFDVGGIGEMVRPGRTGLLVPSGQVEAMRSAILGLLGNKPMLESLRLNCRTVIEQEYTLMRQASAYRELYEQVLGHRKQATS